MAEAVKAGQLYVLATPIGHLGDITLRALDVLKSVDLIGAEDTRHTQKLLSHYGISTALTSLHGHNEAAKSAVLIEKCQQGLSVALVSDAGTPLVSDPGSQVVAQLRQSGVSVVPIPGVCAAIAALSVCGLSTQRFVFEGFLPARSSRRKKLLQSLMNETRTLVFYEAVHRMATFFQELIGVFGPDRPAAVAREMTKRFESILQMPLCDLQQHFKQHPDQLKGEFVVLVAGVSVQVAPSLSDATILLRELITQLPPSKAAAMAARITGQEKKALYALALQLKSAG